jgi:hypothetical protein
MTFIPVTDLYLAADPGMNRLRIAVSRAFGVDPGLVSVSDFEDEAPIPDQVRIILRRWLNNLPGDFPVNYWQTIDADLEDRIDAAYDVVAADLGAVVITDAGPSASMIHLPDGSRYVLYLPEPEEGGIVATPQLRQLIDAAPQSTRRAVAS